LSVLLLIGFSCIQEEDIQTSIDQEISPEIQKVKSWFEKNKVLLQPKPGSANAREFSHDLILPFFEKEPDWEDFYSYQFPDGRQVIEVHLKNLTGIMPTAFMERYGSQADDLTEESLLFIENPQVADGFVPVVARYFSEGQKSEGMTYHQIPLGWTGMIDLFTYDERHLRSIKVENGQLISHIRYQTEEPKDSTRNYSALTSCEPGYWVDFPYWGVSGGVQSMASVWMVECNVVDRGGAPGSSGIPVGPPPGGGTPTNPLPPTGNPGEDDESNNFCRDNHCIPFPEDITSELAYLETRVSLEFENNYRKRMTENELKIFDKLSRVQQLRYLNNAYTAQELAKTFYPENTLHNGCGDAFRHSFFSGLNVASLGFELAKSLGDAHEVNPGSPSIERSMDLYNNELGRNLAWGLLKRGYRGQSLERELWQSLAIQGSNGKFKIINKGSLIFGKC
jgi:hypothetical protein